MARSMLLAALVLLAACARSEEASVVADMNSLEPAERVRTPERDDEELAIGEWRETIQEDYAALEFGPAGAPPLFSLRCDERGGVLLQRHGTVPIGDLPTMLVTIGNDTRRLAVATAGGTIPMLRAALPPRDQMLTTLASVDAPITIRIGDAVPLVLPQTPAFETLVTRCGSDRRGAEAGEAEDAANAAAEANAAAPPAAPEATR